MQLITQSGLSGWEGIHPHPCPILAIGIQGNRRRAEPDEMLTGNPSRVKQGVSCADRADHEHEAHDNDSIQIHLGNNRFHSKNLLYCCCAKTSPGCFQKTESSKLFSKKSSCRTVGQRNDRRLSKARGERALPCQKPFPALKPMCLLAR